MFYTERSAATKQMSDEEHKKRNLELERENAELRKTNDILKNALVFCKRPKEVKTSERHLFVNEFHHKYGTKAICKFLRISKSGYYR